MAEPNRSWTYIPPAWSGTQVEGTSFLPIGRYKMPDGSEQVSFGLPQPMLDAVRAVGFASGREQDPAAPQGYVSQNALMKGGQGLAESAMVGGIAAPKPRNALAMGIKAYHGSPHRFDKFSTDKIGAGEGTQAYGYGLYFAENPAVAKNYKAMLEDAAISIGGNKIEAKANKIDVKDLSNSAFNVNERAMINEILSNSRLQDGSFAASLDDSIAKKASQLERLGPDTSVIANKTKDRLRRDLDFLNRLKNESVEVEKTGALYKVDIDARPDEFIDWDAPLSNQSDAINVLIGKRLEQEMNNPGPQLESVYDDFISGKMTGEQAYRLFQDDKAAADALKSAGIKGVRYLDGTSRARGEGTRNYVVFDDQLITIEDILAANPMAGAVPLAWRQPQEQQQGPMMGEQMGRRIPPEEEAQRQALIRYLERVQN